MGSFAHCKSPKMPHRYSWRFMSAQKTLYVQPVILGGLYQIIWARKPSYGTNFACQRVETMAAGKVYCSFPSIYIYVVFFCFYVLFFLFVLVFVMIVFVFYWFIFMLCMHEKRYL